MSLANLFRKTSASTPIPPHPYYPLQSEILNYAFNERQMAELLTIFAGGCTVLLSTTWFITGKIAPQIPGLDKVFILWFVLSGTIHVFFEGYFVYNHATMAGHQDVFGQLWKEYSLSDSRYLTSDTFTVCMEAITAVCWGPLCYIVALCIAKSHPLRYPLQLIVSLGHIYGDVLYYATSMFDHYHRNIQYCRPEPFYFWLYYFLMNFVWIVIPGYLLYQSVSMTRRAFAALDRMAKSLQANGRVVRPEANGHIKGA